MAKPIKTYSLPLSILTESLEYRFDAGHFSPDLLNALNTLEQSGLELERLGDIVEHVNLPGRFKRIYVESADGLPFLQGSHVVHFQPADLKYLSPASHRNINSIVIRAGWLLVTRSGTVGRVTVCPPEWDGWAASEHIIRIIPNEVKCPVGYLCSFLESPLGQVQLNASIHGAVVDELTDDQVKNVLVPLPVTDKDWDVVRSIDAGMKQSTKLKSKAVTAAQTSMESMMAWLQNNGDPVHKGKDLRIPNTAPEQLAKVLMSGGAKPRTETKKRKAS